MDKHENPRALALKLLCDSQKNGQFSNIALDKALDDSTLSNADKRLCTRLFYGVTERRLTLDHYISSLSSRPLSEIDPTTLNIIRIGIYQLAYTDKIPPHAAINETVNLATRRTSGFVNGILRAYTRAGNISLPDKARHTAAYLSTAYSVGLPLVNKFIEIYGAERTESILRSLTPPPTTIRVNTLKTTAPSLMSMIEGAQPAALCKNALYVNGSVKDMHGFENGLFFVQDEASQICVDALDARPDMLLLDICACPGSKSFGAAINMQNKGKIISFDLHKNKLSLIESGARRLGIDIIETEARDGRDEKQELVGCADRVLCDVPCSGFGVLAKKPELRYKDPAESAALPNIQLAILENACRYVKLGGMLVYSTCTVLPDENEQNIMRFLKNHPDFELCPFDVEALAAPQGYITLLPDTYPTDGFFIAKLRKIK